jgi:hypothetical protein
MGTWTLYFSNIRVRWEVKTSEVMIVIFNKLQIGVLFFVLSFSSGLAQAADEIGKFRVAGDPARAKKTLSAIAGVYKPKVTYEIIGENPEVVNENILEVVPVSDIAAYVKIRTWFVNAHRCEYEGVFELKKNNEFISVTRQTEDDGPCVLKMDVTDKKITFSPVDEMGGSCSHYCSMRAGLYGTEFPRSKKRKIRYMDRLKNSYEYGREVGGYKYLFNRD